MSETEQANQESIEALRQQLKQLQSEHRVLKREYARFRLGMRVLSRSLTSFGLPRRLREYQEVATVENPLPSPQTEYLAASVMNRLIIGTLFSLIAGFGTLTLLIFQTYYLAKHAETLQSQAKILERQVAQQQETTDRIRRSELADKLFRSECFPNFQSTNCPDARHVVADISSALEEYIEAERRRLKLTFNPNWRAEQVSPCANIDFDQNGRVSDRLVNLRKLKLTMHGNEKGEALGISLPGKDLSCIDFTGSVLENADMTGANLSGSRLHGAQLQGAQLNQVNLLDTAGLPSAKLENVKAEAVRNLYCKHENKLATILKDQFSLKDKCNDADDNLVTAY